MERDGWSSGNVLATLLLARVGVAHAEAVGERQQLLCGYPVRCRAKIAPATGVVLNNARARTIGHQVTAAVAQFHGDVGRLESDDRVGGHVLGHFFRRVGVADAEREVAAGRGDAGDQGSVRIRTARNSLPPAGVVLGRCTGQAVPLAVKQFDDHAMRRWWIHCRPVGLAGQVGGVVAVDGKPAEAGVRAKMRGDQLRLAVQRCLPLLEESHILGAAAGRAVRCLKAHQYQAGFEHRVGVGDLVLVETDQAAALVAVGRAGEVAVAHDYHLVEVEIDDMLVHWLDRRYRDRIRNRRIPVETDGDRQLQVTGQESAGALIERQ